MTNSAVDQVLSCSNFGSVKQMRTVICQELSGPDGLTIENRPSPQCPPGQVRVAVKASGLNYVDALFTQGRYQIKPPLPFTPGSEIAGVITEAGSSVEGWSIGERVSASIGLGGYSEEVLLNPTQIVRVPTRLSFGQAATMIQSYATAWFALTRRTQVRPGEWIVVLGAAGGVGLAVIDVAKSLGANVIAAASTTEKLSLCSRRGADAAINYSTEDLKSRVREITRGGANKVLDPIGGTLCEQGLRSLDVNGQLMIIGFATGDIPSIPANQILLRNRDVIGVDWGAWAMANPAENNQVIDEILAAVSTGTINPIEPKSYPVEQVNAALNDLLERRVTGKACLTF